MREFFRAELNEAAGAYPRTAPCRAATPPSARRWALPRIRFAAIIAGSDSRNAGCPDHRALAARGGSRSPPPPRESRRPDESGYESIVWRVSPTTPPFTDKQGQYLAFIYAYNRIFRQPPAEADMQRHFQVSPPSVHQMVLKTPANSKSVTAPAMAQTLCASLPFPEQSQLGPQGQLGHPLRLPQSASVTPPRAMRALGPPCRRGSPRSDTTGCG